MTRPGIEPRSPGPLVILSFVESTLLVFPSSYMVESGFGHMHYLLSKQRNTLKIAYGDLQLKLKSAT